MSSFEKSAATLTAEPRVLSKPRVLSMSVPLYDFWGRDLPDTKSSISTPTLTTCFVVFWGMWCWEVLKTNGSGPDHIHPLSKICSADDEPHKKQARTKKTTTE